MSSFSDFTRFLESRFASQSDGETLWLSIQGYTARVEFRGMLPSDIMRVNLKLMLSPIASSFDERLCIWQDDLSEIMIECMVPEDQRLVHFQQTADYHLYLPGSNRRFSMRDDSGHTTYICYERGSATPETCATKPFTNELQWWLWDHYLLIHGAAVGSGGKGALIIAPSGGGKSTLSLAALQLGMDFAGEDFVLVPREGEPVAHALFPTGNLLPDTMDLFPSLAENALIYMERKGKFVVDLSAYENEFKNRIPLDVLVYPVVCNESTPSIVPSHSTQRFMMATASAAKQVKSRANLAESMRAIVARLKGIPAYEMRLASDPMANAWALQEFLTQLKDTPR